jgi:NAD(P)-dependent dehydrogenase (short-subunit alcohol dehydrogenase family)
MPERVQDHVVAITGAARGIGRATAEALLAAGARVAIGDLDVALAEATAAELGRGCRAYPLDVTDPVGFAAFLDAVEADLGPLDVLVGNAGIMFVGDFVAMDRATIDLQIAVNLTGVLTGMRLAGARMRERGSGHIVTIASVAGLVGAPGGTTYSATKHAVVGASASLRGELRPHGVHVSCVCPSIVRTELGGGLGALTVPPVEPADVAAAVVRILRTRRNLVTVPGWLNGLRAATSWLPSQVQEAINRSLGADRALAGADAAARAAYEARARRATTRDDVVDEVG